MTRRAVCLLALAFLPLAPGRADEVKPKPGYVGVQISFDKEKSAAFVMVVINNGPAEKAGLKGGDRILRIDGLKAADLVTTVQLIRSLKPKKKAVFTIERDGKTMTIDVVPETMG